jgi:hypothetical protein
MHDMLNPGGILINIVPYTWHNHGFFNIDPRLFYGLDESNGYERIAEGFYYPDTNDSGLLSIFKKKYPEPSGMQIIRIKDNYTSDALQVHTNLGGKVLKSNILFFYATQKIHDAEFKVPYDVQP